MYLRHNSLVALRSSCAGLFARAFVLCAVLSLSSCNEPLGTISYLRRDQSVNGEYLFTLPLRDSSMVYDLWIYGRSQSKELRALELNIKWESPSGLQTSETVCMKSLSPKGNKELYRTDIEGFEIGDWHLAIRPSDEQASRLTGLGIILNGTR